MSSNIFEPGPTEDMVRSADGELRRVPSGWGLLLPGDAGLTRRVKAAGDHWVVQEKKGRRTFSRGVWAPAETIHRIRTELEAERATDSYAKRQEAANVRREKLQAEYVEDFSGAVVKFLDVPSCAPSAGGSIGASGHRTCHAGWQRDRGPHETYPH